MSDDKRRGHCMRPEQYRQSLWHAETPAQRRRAIELCSLCPILEACQKYALNEFPLTKDANFRLIKTVVGGLTERQIWHYRNRGSVIPAAFHGTRRKRQVQNTSV